MREVEAVASRGRFDFGDLELEPKLLESNFLNKCEFDKPLPNPSPTRRGAEIFRLLNEKSRFQSLSHRGYGVHTSLKILPSTWFGHLALGCAIAPEACHYVKPTA